MTSSRVNKSIEPERAQSNWRAVVGKIIVPKDIHALILRTCEYVTFHGKRDFADVIQVKDPEMER